MKKNPAKSLGMFSTGLNSNSSNSSNTTKSRSKPISMSDFIEKGDILKEVKENNDEEDYNDKQQKTVESKASKSNNFETNVKNKILKTETIRKETKESNKELPQKNEDDNIDD